MEKELNDDLIKYFGFHSFRSGQKEAIQSLLEGRNTIVVMPTGAGKSLIFQYAAHQLDGITLVISPLIALMQDQVAVLQNRGLNATFINSTLTREEQIKRTTGLSQGKFRLVYIAPERLRSLEFSRALDHIKISLLAVDEAHCISEWGHDFRPDFLYIAKARQSLGNPLTVALTATATPKVQQDIVEQLGLGKGTVRFVTGFNRPNLFLNVQYSGGYKGKLLALNKLLSDHKDGAVIVYSGTRHDAEDVAEFITSSLGIQTCFYHAGLPTEDRTQIQKSFLEKKINIIAATNAFGMGIDRNDVRQVIHFNLQDH